MNREIWQAMQQRKLPASSSGTLFADEKAWLKALLDKEEARMILSRELLTNFKKSLPV